MGKKKNSRKRWQQQQQLAGRPQLPNDASVPAVPSFTPVQGWSPAPQQPSFSVPNQPLPDLQNPMSGFVGGVYPYDNFLPPQQFSAPAVPTPDPNEFFSAQLEASQFNLNTQQRFSNTPSAATSSTATPRGDWQPGRGGDARNHFSQGQQPKVGGGGGKGQQPRSPPPRRPANINSGNSENNGGAPPKKGWPARQLEQDAISPPSAASGGVPEPTPAYTLRASFLPLPAPETRPLLVIIDLNGTLLHRPSRKAPSQFVERPHARTFVSYCLDTFYVVIWSSARPDNVRKMCKQLFTPEQLDRVLATWGRDQFGLSPEDYNRRTQCYKRLTRLWTDPAIAAAHPNGLPWNQGNTVLIDDSPEKARSEPHNAITIPEFVGELNEQPEVLPLVHDYLNTLANQADVSTYIRAHPFKIDGLHGDSSGFNVSNATNTAYPLVRKDSA